MKLDTVHDIQNVYRITLNSMARPGVIGSLEKEADKVDLSTRCYKSTFLIMLMLLDREVSFNVISDNSEEVITLISQMTYAKVKPIEEADYLFVLEDISDKALKNIISEAKIGDLINPNKSATIIAETDFIGLSKEGLRYLEFTGPGIKEANKVTISGSREWIKARDIKNEEYPLGIDLIYLDKNSNILCIPRTTKVVQGEV